MKSGKKSFAFNGGVSLILLLFVILTLLSFAGLSLSSAGADLRLSEKFAVQTTAYYTARNDAQKWLKETDERLAAGETLPPEGLTQVFPAGETLDLRVTIVPTAGGQPPFYRVTEEKTESRVTYDYDAPLSVVKH